MTSRGSWPPELFQLAAAMWRDGKSGEQIGCAIGKSRSAVIGMMTRKGIKTPNSPSRPVYVPICRPEPPSIAVSAQAPKPASRGPSRFFLIGKGPRIAPSMPSIVAALTAPAPLDVTFADLKDGMCNWPVGAGHSRFCGHATGRGHTYCPHHEQAKTARGMAAIKASSLSASA